MRAMRMGHMSRKRGFTLVETVVSVGIIAALAAVVYPAVVKQFDTADPTRIAEDLNSLSTAIETFGINTRPQQPDDIEDLVLRPVAGATSLDSTFSGSLYSTSEAAAWNGPYLGVSVVADAANNVTIITTGFAATIPNHFALYDVDGATPGGDSLAVASVASADFLAIKLLGLSATAYNAVNLLLDGPTESSAALRRQTGRLRCPYGTQDDVTACPVAFYLAQPKR